MILRHDAQDWLDSTRESFEAEQRIIEAYPKCSICGLHRVRHYDGWTGHQLLGHEFEVKDEVV